MSGPVPQVADVVVVGAGPAGTAAAITLARAGRDVVVVDRAHFPRDKCCGDGLTTGALRELEDLGLDPRRIPSWRRFEDAVLRGPSGRTVRLPLPTGTGLFGAAARRIELDAELVRVARAAGATVLEGHRVVGATSGDDRAVVDLEGGLTIAARYVIGADGMWSPLRRFLGAGEPSYRGEWHAFRQYVADVGPDAERSLFVSYEADVLPGYLWSFPLAGGGANIGFGIARGGPLAVGDMKALWDAILERPHVRAFLGPRARADGPLRAWPIPARIGGLRQTAGRALFVGDAAAATDPLTGEGIAQALLTGRWAAEAIVAAGAFDADAARRRYERELAEELIVDHKLAAALCRLMAGRRGADFGVALVDGNDWTRRNFARWLFEDYPRAVLATPRRWHAGMFTGPGTFADLDAAGELSAGAEPMARSTTAPAPADRADEVRSDACAASTAPRR